MALILTSDKVASNPDADWRYMTPYGPTHKELADYVAAIESPSWSMGTQAFAGLDAFISEMKDEKIWSKITEVMPLFGADYAGVRRKLKGTLGGLLMSPVNGDSIGNYQSSGGAYIGRSSIAYMTSGSPALDPAITTDQLGARFGFCAYAQASSIPLFNTSNLQRHLMGASLTSGSSRQTQATVAFNTTHSDSYMRGSAKSGSDSNSNGSGHRDGVLYWGFDAPQSRAFLDDGDEVVVGPVVNYDASLAARSVWLFAKNPFPTDTQTQGWNGVVRFAAFDDGTLTAPEMETYRQAINALMVALGKSF